MPFIPKPPLSKEALKGKDIEEQKSTEEAKSSVNLSQKTLSSEILIEENKTLTTPRKSIKQQIEEAREREENLLLEEAQSSKPLIQKSTIKEVPVNLIPSSSEIDLYKVRVIDEKPNNPLNNHKLVKQKLKNILNTIDSRETVATKQHKKLQILHLFNQYRHLVFKYKNIYFDSVWGKGTGSGYIYLNCHLSNTEKIEIKIDGFGDIHERGGGTYGCVLVSFINVIII